MSEFDYPENRPGCICGRHRSQLEHDHQAQRALQCVAVTPEAKRYDGLLASEAMAAVFPKSTNRRV